MFVPLRGSGIKSRVLKGVGHSPPTSRGMNWYSVVLLHGQGRRKKKEEAEGKRVLRRRTKCGLVMRDNQCLDTDLKLLSAFRGTCNSIWIRRSSFEATLTADAIMRKDDFGSRSHERGGSFSCLDVRHLFARILTIINSESMHGLADV